VTRMKAVLAPLQAAALSLWVMPALVLAQANPQPAPGPRPIGPENMARDSGGSGLLWIIAALVVLAIIWWAMSSRRRHQTMTR
jgi:bacteriorhodopsin